jgi:hypothetical protein
MGWRRGWHSNAHITYRSNFKIIQKGSFLHAFVPDFDAHRRSLTNKNGSRSKSISSESGDHCSRVGAILIPKTGLRLRLYTTHDDN